jgi:hypothetical protein
MSEVLTRSVASWREAHGFGILCINAPTGEHFLVEQVVATQVEGGLGVWSGLSELQLRRVLAERGFSDADTDEAIQLSREWATSVTGSSVFPEPPSS